MGFFPLQQSKAKDMKVRILIYFLSTAVLVALTIFSITLCYNETRQYKAITEYISAVENISENRMTETLKESTSFNRNIANYGVMPMYLPESLINEYNFDLDIMGDGMIGYISIPDAYALLPIYHGSDEKTMMIGAGHIEGSSFPIDGRTVHSVLIGHRGLNYTRLFADLGKVEIGDTFTVYVLNKSCTYQVYSIETVLPREIQSLFIQDGKNLCSLVTCAPFGNESHRLLIHGALTETADTDRESALKAANNRLWVYRAVIVFEILLISVIVINTIKALCQNDNANNKQATN